VLQISDQEILELIKNPDSKDHGFNLLVKKYQKKIYMHIRRIIIQHDDTNDVMQNIFLKIWNNIDKFRAESGLFTWIYRIATNEAFTFLKKTKNRNLFSANSDDIAEYSGSISNQYSGDEIQQRLIKAVGRLPKKQKLVFNMKYYDEMKYEEISQILGTSVGALKASYHHAVNKIEKYVFED